MKKPETGRKLIQRLAIIIFLIPVAVLLSLHLHENNKVAQFIISHKLAFKEKSKQDAFIVSDTLRKLFNSNIKTWSPKNQDFSNQPYFRRSVLQLLNEREAVCGGGTRVLCRILQSMGYDATRVVIFTGSFGFNVHTLVSVVIHGKEYFIDSLNSSDELNSTLKDYDISSSTIHMVPYNKRNLDPENFIYTSKYYPVRIFQNTFMAYSYEAIPLSKLFNTIGVRSYVLNTRRPPLFISIIAESVNLIYLILYLIITILLVLLTLLVRSILTSFRKRNRILPC